MGRDDDASVRASCSPNIALVANCRLTRSMAMPRFAANLTMMFNEWAFLDRFEAAADAGFNGGRVPVSL